MFIIKYGIWGFKTNLKSIWWLEEEFISGPASQGGNCRFAAWAQPAAILCIHTVFKGLSRLQHFIRGVHVITRNFGFFWKKKEDLIVQKDLFLVAYISPWKWCPELWSAVILDGKPLPRAAAPPLPNAQCECHHWLAWPCRHLSLWLYLYVECF